MADAPEQTSTEGLDTAALDTTSQVEGGAQQDTTTQTGAADATQHQAADVDLDAVNRWGQQDTQQTGTNDAAELRRQLAEMQQQLAELRGGNKPQTTQQGGAGAAGAGDPGDPNFMQQWNDTRARMEKMEQLLTQQHQANEQLRQDKLTGEVIETARGIMKNTYDKQHPFVQKHPKLAPEIHKLVEADIQYIRRTNPQQVIDQRLLTDRYAYHAAVAARIHAATNGSPVQQAKTREENAGRTVGLGAGRSAGPEKKKSGFANSNDRLAAGKAAWRRMTAGQ